ncbi:hypothetical protein STENM36S_02072 [Streptomyces tendae]
MPFDGVGAVGLGVPGVVDQVDGGGAGGEQDEDQGEPAQRVRGEPSVPGWTLALDIPAGLPGLGAFLDELDEEVADAGGRVYLTRTTRLRPELLAAMYPRLDDFRALRAELDPRGVFVSDLARRLSL